MCSISVHVVDVIDFICGIFMYQCPTAMYMKYITDVAYVCSLAGILVFDTCNVLYELHLVVFDRYMCQC